MPPSPKSHTIQNHADPVQVHVSNLHARLAATQDALDEIARSHETELVELHDQARYLRAKCQVFKSRAKDAEVERDELKADVNKLVEKVEIANDHRVLPHSRIHLPRPLEFVPSQPTINVEKDVHIDVYVPAILSSLTAELTAQKHAFSELQRVSEARIAALEAQVARRDAELYACSCRSGPTSELPASSARNGKLPPPPGTILSKTQYTLIEEETAIRQRTLEVEIDGLRRKLQSAQSATLQPKLPSPAPDGLQDTGAKFRKPPSSGPTINLAQSHPTIHPVLSDIDRQLALIGKEVGNLQAERDNVKAEVATDKEDNDECPEDIKDENFRGISLIEEECIRLRDSERSLREELLLATAAASATEHSLNSLVSKLQRQIHMLRNPDISVNSSHDQIAMDSEEEFFNDAASEHTITTHAEEPPFSTPPLRSSTPPPRSSLAAQPSRTRNDDHDFHTSPFSDRPPRAPPFPANNPPTPVGRHADPRIARIESELTQARSAVKQKDQAITTLRAQLAAFQKAAQTRTLRGRGGPRRDSDGENG